VAAHLAGEPRAYDLVLADPPYAVPGEEVRSLLARLTEGWLAPDAVVMVERATRGDGLRWPTGLVALREKRYGGTTLWYGRSAPEGEDP
jgi:16S rRNA (guanine966-N2)-methyltransferase